MHSVQLKEESSFVELRDSTVLFCKHSLLIVGRLSVFMTWWALRLIISCKRCSGTCNSAKYMYVVHSRGHRPIMVVSVICVSQQVS